MVLLYLIPPNYASGPFHVGSSVAIGAFAVALILWLRQRVPLQGKVLPLTLDAVLLGTIAVSWMGVRPVDGNIMAEAAGCLIAYAAGIALSDTQRFAWPVQVVRFIVFSLAVASLVAWVRSGNFSAALVSVTPEDRSEFLLGPNGLGAFLAIGTTLEVAVRWRSPRRLLLVPFLCVLLPAILATGSRGAIIILACGLISFTLVVAKHRFVVVLIGVCLVVATLTGIRLLSETRYGDPNSSFATSSQSMRLAAWRVSSDLILAHPLVGVGYGSSYLYGQSSSELSRAVDPHNELLRVGAESGLPALFVLLWLLGYSLWRGLKLSERGVELAAPVFASCVAFASSFVTLQALKSFLYSAPWMLFLGLMAGARPLNRAGARTEVADG